MNESKRTSTMMVESTKTLRPKSFSRTSHLDSLRMGDEDRFVQSALSTLRTGTYNEIDSRINTNKFEMQRYHTEHAEFDRKQEEDRQRLIDRDRLRQTFLDHDRSLKQSRDQHIEDITTRWKATQKVKHDRTKRDLQFELATKKFEDLKALKDRQDHTADNRNGVAAFERNLKRLGIGGGEGPDMRLSVSYEAKQAFEKRLENLALETRPKDDEIQSFKAELKERTAEKKAARYEKARRRRRALVDQDADKHPQV